MAMPWLCHTEAVGYTAGPAPLKYLGLGDLTVRDSSLAAMNLGSRVTWGVRENMGEALHRNWMKLGQKNLLIQN